MAQAEAASSAADVSFIRLSFIFLHLFAPKRWQPGRKNPILQDK
jgi:hypothetical protein